MKYDCACCNYKTNCRNSWYVHKKSQKHITNSTNTNNGNINQNQIDSLIHKSENDILKEKLRSIENEKNIILNQLTETKNQLIDAKNQYEERLNETKNKFGCIIDQYEERLIESRDHIETLKYENRFQKQLINSAGGIIQRSMNTMSYLLLNYNNAPVLTHLPDYSIVSKNVDTFVNDLIFYHKKNKLDKHIGDFIVQQYKKSNPELQSLWSSDVDRLNYFIRELINDKNKGETKAITIVGKSKNIKNVKNNNDMQLQWAVDKKGLKVTEYIIDPLLNYIHEINSNYLRRKNEEINERFNIQNDMKLLEDLQVVATINCEIKNKSLSKSINKYIAPHFYLEKCN